MFKKPSLRALGKIYALGAVFVLLMSTVLWAVLGARIHMNNADQLVDPYLFGSLDVYQQALFPAAHTFLLKWPLFIIISLLGFADIAYIAMTVGAVLLTVGVLTYVLYRIDKRVMYFGTICLCLASSLLMIPTQSYPGALLPMNMAMLATRNIEYVLYLASLWAILRMRKFRFLPLLAAVILLAVLSASDRLFLMISAGGAGMLLIVAVVARQRELTSLAIKWATITVAAALGAMALIGAINLSGTRVSSANEPYALISSLHDVVLAIFYMVAGLVKNMGAWPGYDSLTIAGIPGATIENIRGSWAISYLLNISIVVFCIIATLYVIRSSFGKYRSATLSRAQLLSVMLLSSTIAACGLFTISKHYYVVDGRYVTIGLFSFYVSLATYMRTRHWSAKTLLRVGSIALIAIIAALPAVFQNYNSSLSAGHEMASRNKNIAEVLHQHKVTALVGDYWRVIPAKSKLPSDTRVTPLASCTQLRDVLSSKAWAPNSTSDSFAYLLTRDAGQTDFPACNLEQITAQFGQPNSSVVIRGTQNDQKESLLFYDAGKNSGETTESTKVQAVLPISLGELPNDTCHGTTVMSIVAHEDDDLLFMNPDLSEDIKSGRCVRTVYLTAGDAGGDAYYWLGREQGSQAAYTTMLGTDGIWMQRTVELSGGMFATIVNPKGNSRISLVYLRLPDGNINGKGFASSSYKSLESIRSHPGTKLQTVDDSSGYDSSSLTAALKQLMDTYSPNEVRTQALVNESQSFNDHSDHVATSLFAQDAFKMYHANQLPWLSSSFYSYKGYPTRQLPENVSGQQLLEKQNAFMSYAKHDPGVCQTMKECTDATAYGKYVPRQHKTLITTGL